MKRPKVGDVIGWVPGVNQDHYSSHNSLYDRWDKDVCLVYKIWKEDDREGVWIMWYSKQEGRKFTKRISYEDFESECDYKYDKFYPIEQIMKSKK